ncbi:Putative transposase (identified by ISEscan HMM) [Escherichia coli]|nr:Putative transposase (identified by ISEscan HMM) [Escherichia coli]
MLLTSLHEWMVEKNGTLSKKSRLGEAFSYVLNQWDALCYYSDDGLAEADNNAAERALRAVCLGKKNFMFFGSDHGGERGALLYGLIGTCRLNGIDPEAYLRHILSVLPEWPSNRVDELLPWKVSPINKRQYGAPLTLTNKRVRRGVNVDISGTHPAFSSLWFSAPSSFEFREPRF